MYKVLPLFKSHYSLGKSILTLEEPFDKKGNPVESSIFYILKSNKLDTLVLVEDNISGLLQASKVAGDNKIKLIFGLRLSITTDCLDKCEANLNKVAKYIIFAKNTNGYKNLIKIWSFAAKDGFYYEPCTDFNNLAKAWDEKNLKLAIPFYDSFLFLNTLESHSHVPDLNFTKKVTCFIEDNDLPFDDLITQKVKTFAASCKADIIPAQSIYYTYPNDFRAYMAFRCISKRTTMEKPELPHMGSNGFNFEKWKTSGQ
jgi:DNA polymerase-3 subunit alpha